MPRKQRSQVAPPEMRARVQALVKRDGDKIAAMELNVSRHTVAKVLAGLDLSPGTLALLREGLAGIEGGERT